MCKELEGAQMTSQAFGSVFSWFPYLLVIAIFLFAFSTMISWSYYYGLKHGRSYLEEQSSQSMHTKYYILVIYYYRIFCKTGSSTRFF